MRDLARPRRPWDVTPPEEREYFAILGPGLVGILPPRPPGDEGASGWNPPTGGAWVHVGEDGRVLGFTGKADVGQGTRAALTSVVARVLHVPAARVELVMGDTDLCPWDMGTFGSRSMPDAAPALAAAAAAAAKGLIGVGSERLRRPASGLELVDSEVRPRGETRGLPYADLVRGGAYRVAAEPSTTVVPPGPEGASPVMTGVDPWAEEIVTGRRTYVSDVSRPGMLQGAILWPPSYGARLLGAELEAARALPGVVVVREGGFVGAVAPTRPAARAALREVRARWKEVPQPGEGEIEAYLRTHPAEGEGWDTDEDVAGDVATAYAAAPVRVEATYRTAYIAHVPLEPHCAVAEWQRGRVTVWVGTQTPFRLREAVARELGVAEDDVRVIVPPTGSGFGGKHGAEIAAAAVRLSRAVGRPVRVSFNREEEFRHAYLRPMSIVDVRVGAAADGTLVAWSFRNVNGGAAALRPPYRVAHRKVDNVLSASPLPQGSYRALAANPNNFARESAIDETAREGRFDPLAFREQNLDDDRLRRVLRTAASRAGWSARVRSPGRGWGVAMGLEKGARVATVAEVTVTGDRRLHVDRIVTAVEAGKVVSPDNLRNQVEGAQVMALGAALFEEVHFDHGVLRNPRLSQYRVPRFSDLPRVEVELVDAPEIPPAGAGETPMIAVAPAVANAIFDATGTRLRSLPMAPTGKVPVRPSDGA